MDAQTVILDMLDELHRSFRAETRDLAPEHLFFQPDLRANTIIFLIWHFARTEDGVVHRAFGGTPIWVREGWSEKFGVGPNESGSGFGPEEVATFRPELSLVMEYFVPVWTDAVQQIQKATDEDFLRAPDPERPNATVLRNIESVVVGHGFWHLGEVRFIKGLLGMPFGR